MITVEPEASVKRAFGVMKSMGIRHLPVVNQKGVLEGMVTDRDLRRPKISDVFKSWEDAVIQEAARLMVEKRIGALPVTDSKGTLIGKKRYDRTGTIPPAT